MAYLELTKRTLSGIYLVAISKIEDGKTANDIGQITFNFTIVDAPHKDDIGQTINYQSFYLERRDKTGEIVPNQIGINQLMDFIAAVTGNPPAKSGEGFGIETDELLQQQVTIRVLQEEYRAKDGTMKQALRMKEYYPADQYSLHATNDASHF